MHSWLLAAVGGVLIGGSAALLMLTQGRIAGISGILGGMLPPMAVDRDWRAAFLFGLLGAGIVAAVVAPQAVGASVRGTPMLVVAGLLVGIGTRLGSGCTSGHGVCGLARMSPRSLVSVVTFMATGALTAIIAGGF